MSAHVWAPVGPATGFGITTGSAGGGVTPASAILACIALSWPWICGQGGGGACETPQKSPGGEAPGILGICFNSSSGPVALSVLHG